MINGNVCVLFQGKDIHPAHQIFGDAVNATYRHFETGNSLGTRVESTNGVWPRIQTGLSLSSKYDLVIAEGSAPLQTALVYGTLGNPNVSVVYLAADETFFTLSNRSTKHLWRVLRPLANRVLDGCIAVSKKAYAWCLPYLGRHRHRIAHPPVPNSRYNGLYGLSPLPTGEGFEVLSVGRADQIKNHSALVAALGDIREKTNNDVSLTLVGRGHTERDYASHNYVTTPGYVSDEELIRLYGQADVYVQPSIADAYPVASLEAMLAATPTVVTDGVGTSHRLPVDHICEPTVRGLRTAVKRQVDAPVSARIEMGRRLRSSVAGLTESAQGAAFREAVTELRR